METPVFGAGWFPVAVEEHGVLAGENGDGGFLENHAAALVAERANTEQVVVEVGHDVRCGCWKLGEEDVAGGG